MDWHKRATAVSNALYAEGDRRRLGAYSGFMYGVGSALTWASEQEPTDEEVEAADKAFHEVIMSGEWVTQEQAIRAALLAAQKVRANHKPEGGES